MNWLRARDPGLRSLRRAGRAAAVQPLVFALGTEVIGTPMVAFFAAFGSFALLLLVEFGGPMRERVEAQVALIVTGAVFIVLGTLASNNAYVAALAMALVGFAVLFAGVVSSVLAGATTSLLLAFILPVAVAGPASSIPDRLAGWGIASAASLVAIVVLWPAPVRDPIRATAIAACRALADRLRGGDPTPAAEAVAALQKAFLATPYRPTGLTTGARALVRLVDELRWLDTIAIPLRPPRPATAAVRDSMATVLERSADLLDDPRSDTGRLQRALDEMQAALAELEDATTAMIPSPDADATVDSLDPSFRAQEASYITAQIARNVYYAASAERRGWMDRLLGRQPAGLTGTLAAAQERAGAHVVSGSVWLHNSIRGAMGLGAAVLVADLSGVQRAFWVVLGTLSVLRSNAFTTGQTIVDAIVGTVIGLVIGSAITALVGTTTAVLWALLPIAILFAGFAPAAISFAAGQAAFTVTILIIFNIIQPSGWQLGLLRIEDVALGCAVSLVVGLLFWPRGATVALRRALARAYVESAQYLARAVDYGMSRCDHGTPNQPPPTDAALTAAAASRRLDDAFRGYLAERGAKGARLDEVTTLVTGVAGLRLAGDAVLELWDGDAADDGERATAREAILTEARAMTHWYDRFAASLDDTDGDVPEPLERDAAADRHLVDAVAHDLTGADGTGTATAVRMIWTGDHIDAARRLQESLVEPARSARRG